MVEAIAERVKDDASIAQAPLIELRHASKSYAGADGNAPVTILEDISLEVRDGEMVALLGHNQTQLGHEATSQSSRRPSTLHQDANRPLHTAQPALGRIVNLQVGTG